ncbi:unnamed protein product [Protopolystoma xenopodis]|uniref:Uncharacterized protein n=1 Tax=Protopolystoma xenopodis TaxID=117903 RepID=A0A3S5CK88_9PLAT|nr:unnamed protein product [Protopolystoma xenopodis]
MRRRRRILPNLIQCVKDEQARSTTGTRNIVSDDFVSALRRGDRKSGHSFGLETDSIHSLGKMQLRHSKVGRRGYILSLPPRMFEVLLGSLSFRWKVHLLKGFRAPSHQNSKQEEVSLFGSSFHVAIPFRLTSSLDLFS